MPPKRTRAAQAHDSRATTAADATSNSDKRSGAQTRTSVPQLDGANDGDARRVRASVRNGRTARGQEEEMDFTMSGALGVEYAPAQKTSPPAQKTPAPARPRGRLGRKVARNDTQTQALEALKRRMEEAQVKKTGEEPSAPISAAAALAVRKKKRTSGASTDDSVAVDSPAPVPVQRVGQTEESSLAVASVSPPRGRQRQVVPSSAVKAQGTPMAENSVLALSKFKRRPRQPSILRMVGVTSDVENNDNDDDDPEELTLNYSLGDFEPDHESTPLHLQKSRKSQGQSSEARTGSSRKRKFQELDFEQNETAEVQVPASSPPVLPQTYMVESDASSEHSYSEADELPERVPDTQEHAPGHEEGPLREATPEIYSETQAPPKSTSSVSHGENPEERPEAIPNRRSRRQPQRVKATQDDPDSSSAIDSDNDTETPVRTRKRTARSNAPKAKPKSNNQRPLTTSALASLLPRRRRPQRHGGNTEDPFEIPSSESNDGNANRQGNIEVQELSSDEDELSHDPPPRQRGRSIAKAKGKQPADSTKRKRKANNDAATQKQRGAGRPSLTYGRSRVTSDQENQNAEGQDAEQRNNSDENGDVGEELTKLAQKFAEIDKWEMEFESVSAGNGAASSPWR